MSSSSPTRSRLMVVGLVAGVLLSGCSPEAAPSAETAAPRVSAAASSPAAASDGTVRIATGVSDHTRVIAHMYAQQLEDQNIAAEVVDLGSQRSHLVDALRSGTVDVVPEFTGDLYVHVREHQRPTASATPTDAATPGSTSGPDLLGSLAQLLGFTGETGPTGDDVYRALPDALPDGLRVLDQSPGENTDRFVVTPATAVEYELGDLSTVAKRCPQLVVGLPPASGDSAQGAAGLKAYYDCKPKATREYAGHDQRADALLHREVQAAVLPASAPVIEDDGLRVLEDPDNLYRPEKVVALVSEGLPDEAVSGINRVTGGIHTNDLTTMTRLVTGKPAAMTAEETARFVREQPR